MKPHKWAKEIKAWADGAEIEMLEDDGTWGLVVNPLWHNFNEYRIKPQPKEPHEVSEQYGKAMQQAYEDGFVQGKIYAETGRVSDGKTIPKEPQYLYVYKDTIDENGNSTTLVKISTVKLNIDRYIGKIKLETDDE